MVPVNPSRTLGTNQAPTAVRVRENNESWGGGREAERLEHALVLSSSHLLVFKPRPTQTEQVWEQYRAKVPLKLSFLRSVTILLVGQILLFKNLVHKTCVLEWQLPQWEEAFPWSLLDTPLRDC